MQWFDHFRAFISRTGDPDRLQEGRVFIFPHIGHDAGSGEPGAMRATG